MDSTTILALLMAPGAGYVAVNRILDISRVTALSLESLLDMDAHALVNALPVGRAELAHTLLACSPPLRERAERLLHRVLKAGVHMVTVANSDYPETLTRCLGELRPPLLFVAGDLDLLHQPMAAIVGARRVSDRGRFLAEDCARAFAEAGVTVVSGGAAGVDSTAHEASLRAGGTTVVVLPQGLLTYRMPREMALAFEEGRVVLVSEFVPDAAWATHAAVTRNATISALARMVCVFEPRKEGGSIRTARCALEHGKRVLVHAAPDHRAAAVALHRAGAGMIWEEGTVFSPDRLLDIWHKADVILETNGELF